MSTELIVVKGKVIEQNRSFTPKVGKDIGYELGSKMIKKYFDHNQDDVLAHFMGRDIIEGILAQPGVTGIRIFHAFNELGIKQLVWVGVDVNGNNILNIQTVGVNGELNKSKGIVAGLTVMCPPVCGDTGGGSLGWYD